MLIKTCWHQRSRGPSDCSWVMSFQTKTGTDEA